MSTEPRKPYSEEFLNSFVDNQLSTEEKSHAYLDMGQDPDLNRQICELRKVRDLVQLGYQSVPLPPAARPPRRRGLGMAAASLLALAVALGLYLQPAPAPVPVASPVTLAPARAELRAPVAAPVAAVHQIARPQAAPAATPPVVSARDDSVPPRAPLPAGGVRNRVLVHLADNKPGQLAAALDEVESLMRHYRDTRQIAHVEVIMNGHGLDLVRADATPYAERVIQLQREYRNLTFVACQNTIDRLKREQHIAVRLLPGVIVIDSGVAQILRRQNQGWSYLRV